MWDNGNRLPENASQEVSGKTGKAHFRAGLPGGATRNN